MSRLISEVRRLETQMARWRTLVVASRIGISEDYVATLCREIVNRANLLASAWPGLKSHTVAEFLLDRTLQWSFQGLPLDQIGARLPKNIDDLGALKIAEGGRDGGPLSRNELKQVKRIIQ